MGYPRELRLLNLRVVLCASNTLSLVKSNRLMAENVIARLDGSWNLNTPGVVVRNHLVIGIG
jgi:hypothetical protein